MARQIKGTPRKKRRSKYLRVIKTTYMSMLSDAIGEMQSLQGEMEEWRDNMPESLQDSDKHSAVDEAASALEDASSALESAQTDLEEIVTANKIVSETMNKEYTYEIVIKPRRSRSKRASSVVDELAVVIGQLETIEVEDPNLKEELDTIRGDIEEQSNNLDAVEWPSMMG